VLPLASWKSNKKTGENRVIGSSDDWAIESQKLLPFDSPTFSGALCGEAHIGDACSIAVSREPSRSTSRFAFHSLHAKLTKTDVTADTLRSSPRV
jgi:hypothetical protein